MRSGFHLASVVGVGVGVSLARLKHPVLGAITIGISFVWAGLVRLLLPARHAGLLAVRSKGADCAVLVGLGIAIVVLAVSLRSTYSS